MSCCPSTACAPVQPCAIENFGLQFPSLVGPMGPPGGPGTFVVNYDDLRALDATIFTQGYIAWVSGYSVTGDGGGGNFAYDATDNTTADNDGTVLEPANGVGRWKRVYNGPVWLAWFGGPSALTSGAAVDCSAALTAAIAASDSVRIGPGYHRLDTKVSRNTSNCQILGCGKDVTYIDWHGAGIALDSYIYWDPISGPAGPPIGYVKWGGFTLTDYGSGTTVGLRLGYFTLGGEVNSIKFVDFDYGMDVTNSYYAAVNNSDFEQCGVGLQFTDRCNGFTVNQCRFVTGANPAATQRHLQSKAVATAATYGFTISSCLFDGMGTAGMIYLNAVYDLVFSGATYLEVYDDTISAQTVIELGQNTFSHTISGCMMIGPDPGTFTGKWINVSSATSNSHIIAGNRQYRASGATFLTTTSGNYNISYTDNYSEAPDGTIAAGSVIVQALPVALPATTGSTDLVIPAFKSIGVLKAVRVLFTPSDAVDLTNRFLRVDTIVAGVRTNILNYDFNTHVPNPVLALGETVDCGTIGQVAADVQLLVYIYKVGTALVAPDSTAVFEYYT